MSIIVKKYIKLHLNQNEKKHYVSPYFRCSASLAIWYIMFLFRESWADRILECSEDGKLGLGGDSASFDIFVKNGTSFVGIIDMIQVDLEKDFDDEKFDATLRLDDFRIIAKKYNQCLQENVPYFYLIYLSNDRIMFARELADLDCIFSKKWINYVKVACEKEDFYYREVERSSPELNWFFWLYFRLHTPEKISQYYNDFKEDGKIPEAVTVEEVCRIIKASEPLKVDKEPFYLIKNEDGAIEVRKSILSLRHVLLERAQDGSYEIKDECGIGVFDFLEEFALGFSPERFLEEYEHAAFSEEIHATHKHIEITYSKQENVIRLKLGKAPYEFEYIERDRDRYFECRLFEMSLYEFVALMMYWRALKEKQSAEIFFTQRDDGALVIREEQV
jgi:hypothetical protein